MNADFLEQFLQIRNPLSKKFVIVLHNSDVDFTPERMNRLMPWVKHVYSINTTFSHPKLTTIPIGFPDGALTNLIPRVNQERTIEIYSNFSPGTHSEARGKCLDAFKDDPRVVRKEPKDRNEYYADISRSKFMLCPRGTGIDTHRIYEALYYGAVPVVLHSELDGLYSTLPICIVDSWTDPFYVPAGPGKLMCNDYITPS